MVGQVIGAQGMAGLVQHRQLIWMEIGGAPREGDGLPEVAGGLSGLGDGGGEFQSGVLGGRDRMGVAGHHGGGAGQVHIAEKVELGLIAVAVPEVECPGGDARRVPDLSITIRGWPLFRQS